MAKNKKCPNCGREVAKNASVCPDCAYNFNKAGCQQQYKGCTISAAIIAVGLLCMLIPAMCSVMH